MLSQLSGWFVLGFGDSFLSKSRSYLLVFDFFGLVLTCLGTVLPVDESSLGGVVVEFPSLVFTVGSSIWCSKYEVRGIRHACLNG